MKALFLAASAAALTATLPASASVITIGDSLARSCYVSALVRDDGREALFACDRAFAEEALSFEDRVATHVNRGIVRMLSGDDRGAEQDFRAAIGLDPNQAEAWLNLGVLRYRQENSADAIAMFDRALALRTQSPALAYLGRGLANEHRGNLRAAYADLLRAQKLRPKWDKPARELARYEVRRR